MSFIWISRKFGMSSCSEWDIESCSISNIYDISDVTREGLFVIVI